MMDERKDNLEEQGIIDSSSSDTAENVSSTSEEETAAEQELFQYDMPKSKKQRKKKDNQLGRSFIRKFMPVFVLLIAAAVLATLYFVLRSISPENNGDDNVNMIKVVELNATDVKTMKVDNKKASYTMYKKSGSVYKIEGYEDKPVEEDVISTSIGYMSTIESAKQVMVAEEKMKDYGLDKPAATVTLNTGSEELVLYLGNQSAGGDYYFFKKDDPESIDGKTAVYLMGETQANVCLADRFYYYAGDLSLYDASSDNENITPITIGGVKGTKVNIYMADGETGLSYMLDEPINMPFSSSVMNSIFNLLTALNSAVPVDDDMSETNLEKLGFKDPSYVLSWENNTILRTVYFGNEENGMIYCRTEDMNAVYQISADAVAVLGMNVADMCDIITYTRDVDTLNRIVVTSGKKVYDIETTGTGENRKVTVNNKRVESSIFSEFYATLLGIEVQREGEKPAGNPYLTIEVTLSEDGSKETLSYYEVDERYCYFEMNGNGMFYVKTQDVDNILINVQKVYDNEEIQVVW